VVALAKQGQPSDIEVLLREQAALRRVATLVAEGAPASVLLDAVAQEVGRVIGVPTVTVGRYGAGPSFTVVAASSDVGLPLGSRWPLDGPSMAKAVFEGGRAARIDDYAGLPGSIAEAVRSTEIVSAVGAPIVVDGSVWGFISVSPTSRERLPSDTEERLAEFTELVATAFANSHARDSVQALVDEQTALRRVAVLLAEDASPSELFSAVVAEVGEVLGVPGVSLDRYDADGASSTVVATWGEEPFPVGTEWPVEEGTVAWTVFRTGGPARVDDYRTVEGSVADAVHDLYPDASIVGVPVVVEGRVWGMMGVGTPWPGILPPDTEAKLGRFTDLVATAISSIAARESQRSLAEEQAALRRVATLVAEGATASQICAAVTEEVGRLLEIPAVTLDRYDEDGSTTVLGAFGDVAFPVGSRWPVDPGTASWAVYHTGRPALLDSESYASVEGAIADVVRSHPHTSIVAVPIEVDGRVWGIMGVAEPLSSGIEDRLEAFTKLVATAISNADARDRLRGAVEEQEALRRVATLVARGARGTELFAVVAEEIGRVMDVPVVTIDRYDPDRATTVLATWTSDGEPDYEPGSRWPLDDGPNVAAAVLASGRPERIDDYSGLPGTIAERLQHLAHASSVGVPIVVDDAVWGIVCVGLRDQGSLPADTEARLSRFTDLVATAISNADARDRLRGAVNEQEALRHVATRVAEGAPAAALFSAVAEEVGRVVGVRTVAVGRFGAGPSVTMVGESNLPDFPVGSRWALDGPSAARAVFDSGRAARIDDYAGLPGTIADAVRMSPILSAVGAPIIVDGRVWGYISVSATDPEPLPADTEERLEEFTRLVATAISKTESHDALARLLEQQAALRRVATLVAEGAPPAELFTAVAVEVGELFDLAAVTLNRYEEDAVVVIADPLESGFPLGSRWPFDGDSLAVRVHATHRVARIDDYSDIDSTAAARMREREARSAMGVPIFVEGDLWGLMCVGAPATERLPEDTEDRIAGFVDLVGTAIANAQARDGLRLLAEEQAALRRVATLVARDAASTEVFAAVATEVGRLLDTDITVVGRYDEDGAVTAIGSWSASPGGVPVGTRSEVGGRNVLTLVAETGKPARIDGYDDASGEAADIARSHGWHASVAAPIVVEGRLWGVMLVATQKPEAFPVGAEERLSAFTDLVATALANAQAHDEVRRFADEQAALGRVATLVAEGARTTRVYEAVLEEVVDVFDVPAAWLVHYESDEWMSVLGSVNDPFFPAGSRWPLDGTSTSSTVFRTGRSARVDDFGGLDGAIAAQTRESGFVSSLGVPIVVDGEIWGAVCVGTTDPQPLPADTEQRLGRFTELVATAISNTESRDRVEALVAEQTALHRVAALVARGTNSAVIFDAVCAETGRLIGATMVNLAEFTSDGFSQTVAAWSRHGKALAVGTRFPLAPDTLGGLITQSGAPARAESYEGSSDELASLLSEQGVRSRIGAPVSVEGRLWGALIALSTEAEGLPPGTEDRLARFTELIATAVSNAMTRSELMASRARIVAAGDEARRRIERNLHDGTQQRLVSLGLAVRAAEADLTPEQDDLRGRLAGVATGLGDAVEELQELSRGIHPGVLAKSGLGPALQALAHRSAIPVDLDIGTDTRFAEPIEVAAYFVASEALANAAKHSEASRVDVALAERDGRLVLSVRDNGVGGADSTVGSGLLGLHDRVEAIGGSINVTSPHGAGTLIVAELPLKLDLPQPPEAP
jgi:GAF domain-containing protein